jgi:hypothetical protein
MFAILDSGFSGVKIRQSSAYDTSGNSTPRLASKNFNAWRVSLKGRIKKKVKHAA